MVQLDTYPSFITVDGGEGGTGATFQELEDGVGLPLLTALPIVSGMLENMVSEIKLKYLHLVNSSHPIKLPLR